MTWSNTMEPIVLDFCTWNKQPNKQGNIQQEPQNMEMFMEGTDEEMVKVSMQAQEMCTVAKYVHIAVTDVKCAMASNILN